MEISRRNIPVQYHHRKDGPLAAETIKNYLSFTLKSSIGQEPPSGESTTTECGVNYQLLAVIS